MLLNDTYRAIKIRQGDIKTFEAVFKEYYKMLVGFASHLLSDTAQAEEVVQDVFYAIWKNREKFEIKLSLKSYLYKSVRNNCLQILEHQNVEKKFINYKKAEQSFTATPEDELDAKEIDMIIEKTLETLPEKCVQIFRMNRFEGLKYQEIADDLSISVKTVESNMSRALKEFRISLQQYIHFFAFMLLLFN